MTKNSIELETRIVYTVTMTHTIMSKKSQEQLEAFLPSDVEKLLDRSFLPQNRFVIVKYRPEYYTLGKYTRNEWTSYYDIGKEFDDGILTIDEYNRTESSLISCIKDIAFASGCKMVTVAYIEYGTVNVKTSGPKHRLLCQGSRLLVRDMDDALRKVIREEVWIVFINKNKHFMVDFGHEMYLNIRCPLGKNTVKTIVDNNNLFFDPRH